MNAVPAPDTGPDAGAVWHYGDPLGEQRAAQTDVVLVDRSHRAVLTLTGKDRQTWLHSISTQHVSELPEGASTQNLSLDGQGRVEDHWIQTELGGTTYLDTEPWRGEPLLEYPCWAAPILAHGLLYVRGHDRLVCLELIPAKRK